MEEESSAVTVNSTANNNNANSLESKQQPGQENDTKKNFICGVVEGFYGRPWTTEQRKDLFRKLQKWGMDSYVYAPKDDYKHRAYWRELYTVEEAEFLTGLIAAAKEHGVTFYYALSPGLDMTYSNQKEIQTLKRKLDQVSQFGCNAFALLFDDIEAELSKGDKEVFQTFANAQVSVTNEIFMHLGNPKFLFCPTQYCATRAVPTVQDSEYLNTLGSKLIKSIDIMWTGRQVITKTITLESIQEISEILRRPPVIWDNLHANDYDQKRVFLGPYSGRSPELIPYLRGVMTNPNCEFHANTIAIYTLAYWSHCRLDSKMNSSISSDIKLETENDDESVGDEQLTGNCSATQKIYHPKIALKNAIAEWLPEFDVQKAAWGPITKPQPAVTMVMPIIPIIPSINTCMSLTTSTATSTTVKTVTVPEVNTTQLQALTSAIVTTTTTSSVAPLANSVMNSLVSPTKVVTNDDIVNPIPTAVVSNIELPKKIPISIVPVPIMHHPVSVLGNEMPAPTMAELSDEQAVEEAVEAIETVDYGNDVAAKQAAGTPDGTRLVADAAAVVVVGGEGSGNEPMECSSSLTSLTSPRQNDEDHKVVSEDVVMAEANSEQNHSMQVESTAPSSPFSNADEMKELDADEEGTGATQGADGKINADDLLLLCDLFYLPFEHGGRGVKFLSEFNWLKANAGVLLGRQQAQNHHHSSGHNNVAKPEAANQTQQQNADNKPEVLEWLQRADHFYSLCAAVQQLLRKVANCANKEICHDLFSYVWDTAGALTLLEAFVKWLSLGRFPPNIYIMTQGSYTWFSKGWKEAFLSGDQEPWVFRGGLTADLQRLMPVDSGNDLFLYKMPDMPTTECYFLRPYAVGDEKQLYDICMTITMQHLRADKTPADADGASAGGGNGLPAGSSPPANCDSDKGSVALAESVRDLLADTSIGAFINLSPELCVVAHNAANSIVGYVAAAINLSTFGREYNVCWLPDLQAKYPKTLLDSGANDFTTPTDEPVNRRLADLIAELHISEYQCPAEVSATYPAVLSTAVLDTCLDHLGICKRLLTVALATLRSNGCFGVHARINGKDASLQQFYNQIGFIEVHRDLATGCVFMGRRF